MTKEEIQTRLNYLVDFAVDNQNVNNPQMMTNCADDILEFIEQLQKENEELKKQVDQLQKQNEKALAIIDRLEFKK